MGSPLSAVVEDNTLMSRIFCDAIRMISLERARRSEPTDDSKRAETIHTGRSGGKGCSD
jgi:hypothetical protein